MRDGDMPRFVSSESAASSSVNFHSTVFWTHSEDQFLQLMRNYGFTEQHDLDLLSAKYFRNLSVRDIEEEFGWTSKSAIQRKLKELRDELIKRGFEQELS